MKIAHLTTVHPRYDTRIYVKQCRSLAEHGYDVTLLVADGKGDEFRDGVRIVDVGRSRGRLSRVIGASRRAFKAAIRLGAEIYHIHDPELIPVGLRLRASGKKVLFDAHEDFAQQILSKHYLPRSSRRGVSALAGALELFGLRRLHGTIAANPANMERLKRHGIRCVNINNFPSLKEIERPADWSNKRAQVCYVGAISETRGAREMVQACALLLTDTGVVIAGPFNQPGLHAEMEAIPGWQKVTAPGYLDRGAVKSVLDHSFAGLVTLHPTPAYLYALPVKMFEYMAAGIPVIASNFELHRSIVEGADCGICVDPNDPAEIAQAIDYLATNRAEAERLGRNGRIAVETRYNWETEEKKLFEFYEDTLARA